MTQEKIDEMKREYAAIDMLQECYYAAKAVHQKIVDEIVMSCDHRNPDGTTAIESGFVEDVCLICHRSCY